jgi:hypothetical protein
MNDELSSRATLIVKRVLPVIWIFISLMVLFVISRSPRTNGAALGAELLPPLVLLTVAGVVNFWIAAPLCRIQMRDGRLFASNFRREIELAPSDIERVTQNVWINIRTITIHLRERSALGKRIRFMPPSRVILRFWVEDPVVDQLRAFALRTTA